MRALFIRDLKVMKALLLVFAMLLCGGVFAKDLTSNPIDGIFWKKPPSFAFNVKKILKDAHTSHTDITVVIETDESGKVVSVDVIKSSQILALDYYVVDAFKKAAFFPFLENGKYFPIKTEQTVVFIEDEESFKSKLIKFFK